MLDFLSFAAYIHGLFTIHSFTPIAPNPEVCLARISPALVLGEHYVGLLWVQPTSKSVPQFQECLAPRVSIAAAASTSRPSGD